MARSKLARMLLENQSVQPESSNISGLTKLGIEHITNVSAFLKEKLRNWDKGIDDYDSLFEIAKIAYLTDKEDIQLRCHMELARYQYPQIRSLEIQSKEDKEVRISVHLADYAQSNETTATPVEAEDIEIETEKTK